MSRLTTAQIVEQGRYLEPDFDPTTLTVPQLLGIFGYHNIRYPTPYTKPKLVQLFNEEIKPQTTQLKKEKLKRENSAASDDGIKDGVTGKLIGGDKKPPVRRSSRRLSRPPSQDEKESSPPRPDPPKRRRSSAQPSLGGPSTTRKAIVLEPAVAEESEPEELPPRKISRSKKASGQNAKKSRPESETHAEDSGWEDNNVFQSGAESSSPAKPSPSKARARRTTTARTTTARRSSRKASSAPPHLSPSPPKQIVVLPDPPPEEQQPTPPSPPRSTFEPDLPSSIFNRPRKSGLPAREVKVQIPETPRRLQEQDVGPFEDPEQSMMQVQHQVLEDELDDEADNAEEDEDEGDETVAIARRISGDGDVIRHRPPPAKESSSLLLRILVALCFLAVSPAVYKYKTESAQIGFCDPGRDTNEILETMKTRWAAIDACHRDNTTFVQLPAIKSSPEEGYKLEKRDSELVPCPPPDLVPLPHPTICTPCPAHAKCRGREIVCEDTYLFRPHPLLAFLPAPSASSSSVVQGIWQVIELANGLPGMGPVAFPPRCLEDPKRKRNIGVLGKVMVAYLGQERGKRLCMGDVHDVPDKEGGQARTWGLEMEELKAIMRRRPGGKSIENFDSLFNEAVGQLIEWGGVITSEDSQGRKYLAHSEPNLDLSCLIRVKTRETWHEWQARVFAVLATVLSTLYYRRRRASRQAEDKRVSELVPIVLDALRNQELAHHTDPITTPHPYLSSLQLRDLILQDEHSISTRTRLWNKVEHVVESNANVRANLEELPGGDEMRVWRWVGSTSPTSPRAVASRD
ncbi:hypothetical protein GLOTRDRAFT_110047 [Gloeophyllum trabeum ATCC 11539]|uniref:Man1/Src1 C-terminal domain-containing protein n=1 Tax=Gloeophyllum trabeum (strain ATCC 11539 / FP-39264 / Madison 617) TaxID=670483 RepID=S7QEB7_GLOTA|nr:uncharacterized protein GLOTRDRAFT_110047 [Gloeophyllum trabeum ATCC 11539]EPQ58156.1 hypothetical protein GLOTRDRAFT_110047 [Gloeophyllum trabeum ATCC 11539]